jgi:hypothetical protein
MNTKLILQIVGIVIGIAMIVILWKQHPVYMSLLGIGGVMYGVGASLKK